MLSTDRHNPMVTVAFLRKPDPLMNQEKITFDQWKYSLRGLNEGTDFDIEMLKGIFDRIIATAFQVLPDGPPGRNMGTSVHLKRPLMF